MEILMEWPSSLEQLDKAVQSLVNLAYSIQGNCIYIQQCFKTVSKTVIKIVDDQLHFLKYDMISKAENIPINKVVMKIARLNKERRDILKSEVIATNGYLNDIKDIYAEINKEVNMLRSRYDMMLKEIDSSVNITEYKHQKLNFKKPSLIFPVLREEILPMLEHKQRKHMKLIKELDKFIYKMDHAPASVDSIGINYFKHSAIHARHISLSAFHAYKMMATALEKLQVRINECLHKQMPELKYLVSMLPTVEAVTLALQSFQSVDDARAEYTESQPSCSYVRT